MREGLEDDDDGEDESELEGGDGEVGSRLGLGGWNRGVPVGKRGVRGGARGNGVEDEREREGEGDGDGDEEGFLRDVGMVGLLQQVMRR